MTSPCTRNPARLRQIKPAAYLRRSRQPLAQTMEDSPEACFQAQAAVTVPELCEEVVGGAKKGEPTSSSTSMRQTW